MVCGFGFFSFKSATSSLCCGTSSSEGITFTLQTELKLCFQIQIKSI